MTERKLKPFVKPLIGSTLLLVIAVIGIISLAPNNNYQDDDYVYVTKEIFSESKPVVSTKDSIIRPYTSDKVKVYTYYYDYEDDANKQQKSILYYQNTYLQNSGIDYYADEEFQIISIIDGTVVDVKEDTTLGTTVEIRHNNDLMSVYQGINNLQVKKNQVISQGDVIGTSGASKINSKLPNTFHFEIYHQGSVVNPELYYDKKIAEL